MVVTLDELGSSSTDGGNGAETNANDSSDEPNEQRERLQALCDELDADFDHAMKYVAENGQLDRLVDYANFMRDADDEVWQDHEQYRRLSDQNRIKQFYLNDYYREHDVSFEKWVASFYGDSDDPAAGTFNAVQQSFRSHDQYNLMLYKALFPEPQEAYWASQPVLWLKFDTLGYKDGQQDSHIYVEMDFAEEYGDFTMEVDGKERPRPPSDEEIAQMQSGGGSRATSSSGDSSQDIPDPTQHTVDSLKDRLAAIQDVEILETVLDAEKATQNRKTAVDKIEAQIKRVGNDDEESESDDSDDSGSIYAECDRCGHEFATFDDWLDGDCDC
jgi:hypothetical protein